MLQNFSYQDLPTHRDKATPLGIFIAVAELDNPHSQISQGTAYLIHIALFFYLRSCKYTKTPPHRRTIQFRFRNLQFNNNNGIIPYNAPAKLLT